MINLAAATPVSFILTPDPARLRPFYEDVLGLPVMSEDDFAITFSLNGAPLRLTRVEGWAPHPHTVLGWLVDDISAAVSALRKRGVEFAIYEGFGQDALGIWRTPDGQNGIAWFHDPDGNNLSISGR